MNLARWFKKNIRFSFQWFHYSSYFRDTILKLLLDGARELGHIVCSHIRALLNELNSLRRRPDAAAGSSSTASTSSTVPEETPDSEGVDKSKGFLLVTFSFPVDFVTFSDRFFFFLHFYEDVLRFDRTRIGVIDRSFRFLGYFFYQMPQGFFWDSYRRLENCFWMPPILGMFSFLTI